MKQCSFFLCKQLLLFGTFISNFATIASKIFNISRRDGICNFSFAQLNLCSFANLWFSPASVHLFSFVILIHRSRRSRFYQHLGPSWATLYSIFLNAYFIRLCKRRSCERKVTLYRMAIPLLKNFFSVDVQYSWLLSSILIKKYVIDHFWLLYTTSSKIISRPGFPVQVSARNEMDGRTWFLGRVSFQRPIRPSAHPSHVYEPG